MLAIKSPAIALTRRTLLPAAGFSFVGGFFKRSKAECCGDLECLKKKKCAKDECCGDLECIKQKKCQALRQSPTPCFKSSKYGEQVIPPPIPFKSMWEHPAECCKNPCPDMLPRFDEIYWKHSDKKSRIFTQTWAECPELVRKPKILCCFQNALYPPMEKRVRPKCPKTACSFDDAKMAFYCKNVRNLSCPRISMPCCKVGRYPPRCYGSRTAVDCTKECCPYPAYSECKKPPRKKRRCHECRCTAAVSVCESYAYYRYKKLHGIK